MNLRLGAPDTDGGPRSARAENVPAPHLPEPEFRSGLLRWLPLLVAVAVLPGSMDGFDDIKLWVFTVAVGVAGLQMLGGGWWGTRRRLGAPGIALVVFLALATAATIGSDTPLLSIVGGETWYNGLLVYLAGALLCVLVGGVLSREELPGITRALTAGSALAVLVWLAQLVGFDPFDLAAEPGYFGGGRVFTGTFSNPNFSGAFVAAALPGAVWAACRAGLGRRSRVLCVMAVALLGAGVAGSHALQAPVAAGAGLAVLAIAACANRSRRAAVAALILGAVFVATVGLGLVRIGPLSLLGHQETFVSRTWDWTAAARIAADEPLTGVGFARFGAYVRAYRPPGDVVEYGWETIAYAAHNIPLDMAAGGGFPLMLAYLAFVGLVGFRLIRGLFSLGGKPLLLLGVFGGMWAAYQAQSLVSLDVPQLVFLHFLSAGAILALTAPDRQGSPHPAGPTPAGPGWPLQIACTAVVLVAAIGVGRICIAELFMARVSGDPVMAQLRTVAMAPWIPRYWTNLGNVAAQEGNDPVALRAWRESARRDPREVFVLRAAADAARRQQQPALALSLLRDAVRVEPQSVELMVSAAEVALELGYTTEAARLLDAALAFDPRDAAARRLRQGIEAAPTTKETA